MKVIVHPSKGSYRLIFTDGGHVLGTAMTALTETPKGLRPLHYRVRWGARREFRNTPSRDLISSLRNSEVVLTHPDPRFSSFLSDFQVSAFTSDLCRMCLLEDRITPLSPGETVLYRKGEWICMRCARKEIHRELANMGRIGRRAMAHLDDLLAVHRSVDAVLASIQPQEMRMAETLFDRLEAHGVAHTQRLEELALPRAFTDASGVSTLMPAQQLAVESGLLFGKDLLVVSATASGKTFIGEMAGLKNYLEGRGKLLFLVPLVALAVQKYQRFSERYGEIAGAGVLIGRSRLNLPDTRQAGDRNVHAPILVGTYEGLDHMIRCGKRLGKIGTVVIDEVQMLEDRERGHRLDGLIARLKFLAPNAQFLYLSATIGSPKALAAKLQADLVRYDERPVSLERYLIFTDRRQKIPTIKRLCDEEYAKTSSKGFRGQSIVFSHSRARCEVIAQELGPRYAAYHAGLTARERRDIEARFTEGSLNAVITTAALGAGVDFPASQVIFDSLAMGIDWLSVQEFSQMAGRAGRPDYHDLGRVVILAEPGCAYARGNPLTEDEMALRLLRGEMEEVAPEHDLEQSSEEYVANAVVAGGKIAAIGKVCGMMVGSLEPPLPALVVAGLVRQEDDRIILSDLARVMAAHFLGMEHLLMIQEQVAETDDAVAIVAALDTMDTRGEREEREKPRQKKEKKEGGPGSKDAARRRRRR